jgi:hypothetical protein
VSIAGLPDGSAQVVATGKNDALVYHDLRNPDGSWTGWQPMQGYAGAPDFAASDVSIAATGGGSTQVVAIGQGNGLVYHNLRNPDGTWTGWQPMQGYAGAPAFGGPAVSIAGFTNGTSRVIAVGNDAAVYEDIRNADGTWTGWTSVSTAPAIDVAAAGLPDGSTQLLQIAR